MKENEISHSIIGAAIEVHREIALVDGVVRIVNRFVEPDESETPPDLQN
jgi:hypothetical protein